MNFYLNILSGIPSECQTDWIQIRPDILSGLIWVQTVCKSYQQTTLVDNNQRSKIAISCFNDCRFCCHAVMQLQNMSSAARETFLQKYFSETDILTLKLR